uniref:Putative zinc finger, CCHC-type n=1 Tax=Helianthus annuus TaxID=4232 RepID=A0A251TUQ9_HELAN
MASSSSDPNFSHSISHMITMKLTSDNYLAWVHQISTILKYHKLITHIDGSSSAPVSTITSNDKTVENPEYAAWAINDHRTIIILNASLSEEAVTVIIGLPTARDMWVALENAYGNTSIERVHNLRDQLRLIQKGPKTVAEFGRTFKNLCDQLSAIGYPVDPNDQIHWFLCGLGPSFETFSTAVRSTRPAPSFPDLLARAESHELFARALHGTPSPPVAFSVQSHRNPSSSRGRGGRSFRGSNPPGGRGGRARGRRPPHCQLCRRDGHYANACPNLATFASQAVPTDEGLANAFLSQCNLHGPDWCADSGATDHMTPHTQHVNNPSATTGNDFVTFGNGNTLPITHKGHSIISNKIKLNDVLVVPSLTKNLLSISKLTKDNCVDVLLSYPLFHIQDRHTKQVLARGRCENGLYILQPGHHALVSSSSRPKASFEVWHSRLGHVHFDVISILQKLGILSITSLLPKPVTCRPCQLAKSQRLPFELNNKRALHPLDLIHCDLWGPSPVVSVDNYRYYVAFVDDHSRFCWIYPLRLKSEFYKVLTIFMKFVQTQFSRKIKVFQSDGGTEFVNHNVRSLFEENGTFHRLSCPYTPQQNGRVERKHRHIVETGLAMMFNAKLPSKFWVDAFSSAVYIINRLPTPLLNGKSPFEVLFSETPNYNVFRAFGCRVFPYLRDYSEHKLAPRSIPCIFIGYSPTYKGYRCLDPTSSRVYITRHARFNENIFPFHGTTDNQPFSTLPLTSFDEDTFFTPHTHCPKPTPTPTPTPNLTKTPCHLCMDFPPPPQPIPETTPSSPPPSPNNSTTPNSPLSPHTSTSPTTDISSPIPTPPPPPPPPLPTHPMITRAKAGVFRPRHIADLSHVTRHPLHQALFASNDPKGFKTAIKDAKWSSAMHKELDALYKNNTWSLVPRPVNRHVVGSKWLFRTKYHSDGSVERHKARLVAQGFSQFPGIDYSHTFSPVVKASTVRIILSLAILNDWRLHQLDVNNAFLHGHLNECVYMEQPPGFINPNFPNHVCKLNKALYGLKQAPRAWFHRLSTFLISNGFKCSRADPSLFIFKRDNCIMYLLVYVDDLILTGNQDNVLRSFINRLHNEFAIKDLGELNYFLGLEVTYTSNGLFLNQSKYASDILVRACMMDAKPATTPLATNVTFSNSGELFSDPTQYRSIVGALQYLTITRPDISYAVNQVSQFLHAPTIDHFQGVKRILRYIKGTLSFGLTFSKPSQNTLIGFSDADWARCLETRRSTYGYSIFLGGNLVSWSAKKQPTVSRSSCESEYRAMANTAAEIIWITHLLRELHALPASRPTILCDNRSAIFLTQNPVSHKRVKHLDIDYHFIRELVSAGKLHTRFIPSKLQVADIFTKSLPYPQFDTFRKMLRLGPPPSRLRGDINL